MTTKVKIELPPNNHKRIKVKSIYISDNSVSEEKTLNHGESIQLYVHGSMFIKIEEVD